MDKDVRPYRIESGLLSTAHCPTVASSSLYHCVQGPVEVSGWPVSDVQFGQVAGVDVTPSGDVMVFHRGEKPWMEE